MTENNFEMFMYFGNREMACRHSHKMAIAYSHGNNMAIACSHGNNMVIRYKMGIIF